MVEGKTKELTICGTLFPTKWDDKGQVERLVIDTVDQDEYYITQNKMGKELLRFTHQQVEIKGTLRESDDGHFFINVKSYRIIKGESEGSV